MYFHRVDYTRHEPAAFRALLSASQQVHEGVLGHELAELVFLRVSQLNGCAYCIDMHATALRKAGIEPRALTMAIAVINAWNRLGVGLQPAMP
ncbi:carboxymuconolactone decarboxylase family protein [Xanthomonas translucens pv. translucens]|uniref:carboxymuconolactone decarboxylase family protein n=1 Tax=Xanthomonas campestris pv. translucens TaxID=343 RepID=UPI003F6FCD49